MGILGITLQFFLVEVKLYFVNIIGLKQIKRCSFVT